MQHRAEELEAAGVVLPSHGAIVLAAVWVDLCEVEGGEGEDAVEEVEMVEG